VELARADRDELRRKVAAGIAGVPDERLRLLWIQNRLQFRAGIEELLEERYGAAVVADELNAVTWPLIDPAEPFVGLARRLLSSPFTTDISGRIRHLQAQARTYQVDGAVNPCHWGCRQGTGARGLIASGLREVGVPTLNLEVDCVDRRSFSEGQVRTRLEAFMEMLFERRQLTRGA
jgi:benzoyl-CoA reductase/2-hydroxyglutaryl-CoA dehydratase subunit BcrC/BadD/HgdB